MDSAVCNTSQRPRYLKVAYDLGITYTTKCLFHTKRPQELFAYMKWVNKRGACVTNVFISPKFCEDESFYRAALDRGGLKLTSIHLDYHKNLAQWITLVGSIGSQCPHAKHITCPIMDPAAFNLLCRTWPGLESIDVDTMPLASWLSLGTYCKHLKHLKIHDPIINIEGFCAFLELSGVTLQTITGHGNFPSNNALCFHAIAKYCPHLQTFDLHINHLEYDDALQAMLQGCSQLTELSLPWLLDLRPAAVTSVTAVSTRLTVLSLCPAHDITEAMLVDLIQHCPNLRSLCLTYAGPQITTEAVITAIGQCCGKLEALTLHCGCGDAAIGAIAQGCPQLRRLSVQSGTATDAGLIAVMSHCPHLTYLSINQWRGITDASLHLLPQLCPQVTELRILRASVTVDSVRSVLAGCTKLHLLETTPAIRDALGVLRKGLQVVAW